MEASPDRVLDTCPVSRQCGGCSLRHISYHAECQIKQNWVTEHFRRIGGIDLTPLPIQPSPSKALTATSTISHPARTGWENSNRFFRAPQPSRHRKSFCDLQPHFFGEILGIIQIFLEQYRISIYNEQSHQGLVRHLFLRWGEQTREAMVCLVINGTELPHANILVARLTKAFPQIVSIQINCNTAKTNVILGPVCRVLYGKPVISDILCGIKVELSPLSFLPG